MAFAAAGVYSMDDVQGNHSPMSPTNLTHDLERVMDDENEDADLTPRASPLVGQLFGAEDGNDEAKDSSDDGFRPFRHNSTTPVRGPYSQLMPEPKLAAKLKAQFMHVLYLARAGKLHHSCSP